MLLRTLGGARIEGTAFARPKPLLLLTYLALEGRRPRRHLAELFWPEARDPLRSLSVALARLRKGAPGAVTADRRHAASVLACDATAFLDHLRRGERESALALYDGPFLDGLRPQGCSAELEEWLHAQRELLAGRALRARLVEAEREAAAGRLDGAADLAESAVRLRWTNPEPDELRRLHDLLTAADRAAAARVRQEAEGLGLELPTAPAEARLRLIGAPGADAAGAAGAPELPRRDTVFVGRDGERIEIASLLARPGPALTTLLGPPGVGKTRLALEIAREQRAVGAFPGGVRLIELERIDDPAALSSLVAASLGVDDAPTPEATLARISDRLADEPTLVVLDNAEHLAAGASSFARLAEACPDAALLVTSRERLRLEAERVVPVKGLPYPEDDGSDLDEALAFGAVELFVQRARRALPDFTATVESLPSIARICRRVEGLPLALELAAAWVRVLTPAEIADELEGRLELLARGARDAPERQRSVRSAFEHAWARLGPRDRELLRRLSVCRGGFGRAEAAEIAGAGLDDLATLIDRSLLRSDGGGRYGAHPLLLEFARGKASARPREAADARRRHAGTYLALLGRHEDDLAGGDQGRALAAVGRELENVVAAWRHAAASGAAQALWRACRPLQLYFIQRGGRWDDAAEAFADARRALQDADPSALGVAGRLAAAEAWFRFRLGELDASERLAHEAHARLVPLGDAEPPDPTVVRALASTLNTLGNVAKRRGAKADAAERFEQVLALARRRGHDRQVAIASHNLASVRSDLGEYPVAEELYREALAINRRLENHRSVVRNLVNMGNLALHAGEPERAEARLGEALELARAIGFEALVPTLLTDLGEAALAQDRPDRAARLLGEALEGLAAGTQPSLEANVWTGLADAAAVLGRPRAARAGYLQALQPAWSRGERDTVAACLAGLARLRRRDGDAAGAALLLEAADGLGGLARHVRDRLRSAAHELGDAWPRADRPARQPSAVIEGLLTATGGHGELEETP